MKRRRVSSASATLSQSQLSLEERLQLAQELLNKSHGVAEHGIGHLWGEGDADFATQASSWHAWRLIQASTPYHQCAVEVHKACVQDCNGTGQCVLLCCIQCAQFLQALHCWLNALS